MYQPESLGISTNFEKGKHKVVDSRYQELQEDTSGYSPCRGGLHSRRPMDGHLSSAVTMLLCQVDQLWLTSSLIPSLI